MFNSNSIISTGILSREEDTNLLLLTFLNTSKKIQKIKVNVLDWSLGYPKKVLSEDLYLIEQDGVVKKLPLLINNYDGSVNIKLYEIKIEYNKNNVIFNYFNRFDNSYIHYELK